MTVFAAGTIIFTLVVIMLIVDAIEDYRRKHGLDDDSEYKRKRQL